MIGKENIHCECCASDKCVKVTQKRIWHIYKCQNCGLFFVWKQPSEDVIRLLYDMSAGYYQTAERDLSRTSCSAARDLVLLLSQEGLKDGRLLDVGCSTGKLIYHLRRFGWLVAGCDLNHEAVEIAAANGLDVKVGNLEDINSPCEYYDAIHMGDVLEHVRKPLKTLQTANRLLKREGLLIIRTPNATSTFALSTLWLSRAVGFTWAHSEAPYHLFEFTPRAIDSLVRKTGFEPRKILFHGKVSFPYVVGASGFFDNLKSRMKAKGKYSLSSRTIFDLPLLAAVAGLILPFWILSRIGDRVKKAGQSLVIVARKV